MRTWQHAVAYKPNIAFFEARGAAGIRELETVMDHRPDGRVMILDAKRGDLGSTAEAYRQAVFEHLKSDAVTASPYLGGDSLVPLLSDPARGVFALCHTSNPGAQDLQHLDVGGRPLYLEVARQACTWNTNKNLGLVVGATYPDAIRAVREEAPELPFLVPGVGAQGGDVEAAVRASLTAKGAGLVINSSRGIIYAGEPAEAAARLSDAINRARSKGNA